MRVCMVTEKVKGGEGGYCCSVEYTEGQMVNTRSKIDESPNDSGGDEVLTLLPTLQLPTTSKHMHKTAPQ